MDHGWWPLLAEAEAALAAIDPDFTVRQVKEKWGEVWIYLGDHAAPETARAIIVAAQSRAHNACERCGAAGTLGETAGGWRVACAACRAPRLGD